MGIYIIQDENKGKVKTKFLESRNTKRKRIMGSFNNEQIAKNEMKNEQKIRRINRRPQAATAFHS